MLRAKKKRLIRKNRMCDIQKVESICMDLSFGHSQYIDDIYASIYFIRNMLPLSNAFYHFGPRDVHFFSSSNVYSFLLSVEKEACIFSRQSFFLIRRKCHCYICIATYVWNVIECCILPVMLCK